MLSNILEPGKVRTILEDKNLLVIKRRRDVPSREKEIIILEAFLFKLS